MNPEVAVTQWDVDERPATICARTYMLAMRLGRDKRAFEGASHTLRVARTRQRSGNRPPTLLSRHATSISTRTVEGMRVWIVRPRKRAPAARVLYVHGGGYIHPLTSDYWRLVRALVRRASVEVIMPVYPLAPDATIDDVMPKLLRVNDLMLRRDPRLPTILMGDSAGGALVIAMAIRLRDLGEDRPAGIVALSPWLDATLDEATVRDLEPSDPMLAESGLRAAGRWWAGLRSPSDPIVSPVKANLADLPPLDVFIGARDILRPAVDDLAEQARRVGAPLHVHEKKAMFHVWMTRAIPEGRRTRRELARLILERAAATPKVASTRE